MSPASQSEFSEATPIGRTEVPGTTYTLLVLNDRTIYAVTDCWLENGRIFYITPTGAEGSVAFGNMDWKATNLINAQQGVGFVLRLGREAIRN